MGNGMEKPADDVGLYFHPYSPSLPFPPLSLLATSWLEMLIAAEPSWLPPKPSCCQQRTPGALQ